MSYMCLRDKLVAGAKADQLSAAVVFLPQNTLHFGKHGKECFCVAMYGKVSFKKGRVKQSNFDDYRIATMKDSPREIVTELVDSDAPPAGVGETPVPSFAPALCNAVFAATGKRIRSLPLADHDLSWS